MEMRDVVAAAPSRQPFDRSAEGRAETLATFLARVDRKHGRGAVVRLGEEAVVEPVEVIPTGLLAIDLATGIGGIPRGRVIEIYGDESSGKSTLAMLLVARVQRDGGTALVVDTEQVIDLDWCRRLGVDTARMLLAQPSDAEEALDIVEQAVASGAVDLVVLDSVAALAPIAEQQAEVGEEVVAAGARLLNRAIRRMAHSIHTTRTAFVAINQLRMVITPRPGMTYEPTATGMHAVTTTPGGMGLKFAASLRIELARTQAIRDGAAIIGNRIRVRVAKNKLAPPLATCTIDLYYDGGPCAASSVIDVGLKTRVLTTDAGTIRFDGQCVGRGRVAARDRLRRDAALCDAIADAVRATAHSRTQGDSDAGPRSESASVVQLRMPEASAGEGDEGGGATSTFNANRTALLGERASGS